MGCMHILAYRTHQIPRRYYLSVLKTYLASEGRAYYHSYRKQNVPLFTTCHVSIINPLPTPTHRAASLPHWLIPKHFLPVVQKTSFVSTLTLPCKACCVPHQISDLMCPLCLLFSQESSAGEYTTRHATLPTPR